MDYIYSVVSSLIEDGWLIAVVRFILNRDGYRDDITLLDFNRCHGDMPSDLPKSLSCFL